MVYLITYDLHQPGRDYSPLHEALKSFPGWWHYLESTWLVVSTRSAGGIRDALKRTVDLNDEILVIRVTLPWAASNLDKEGVNWLKKHKDDLES